MTSRLEEIVAATEAMETALHEGRALLKDLRRERKEIEKLIRHAIPQIKEQVENDIGEELVAYLRKQVEDTGLVINQRFSKMADEAMDKVYRLINAAVFGNEQGRGESAFSEAIRVGAVDREQLLTSLPHRYRRRTE